MILQEINHKMAIYRDCTLGEILFLGAGIFIIEILSLSSLFKLLFGYASIGVALTFITFFHVTKLSLNYLQKVKYGKPYGYYKHLSIKKLAQRGFFKHLFIIRQGKWSVRRAG